MEKLKKVLFSHPLSTEIKILAIGNLLFSLGLIVAEAVLLFQNGITGVQNLNPEFPVATSNFEVLMIENSNNNNTHNNGIELENISDVKKMIFEIPILNLTISLIWVLTWIMDIGASVLLFHAASNKILRECQIWFYYRCAFLFFRIIFLIIYALAGYSLISKIPVIILFLLRIYSIVRVNQFIHQLSQSRDQMSLEPQ